MEMLGVSWGFKIMFSVNVRNLRPKHQINSQTNFETDKHSTWEKRNSLATLKVKFYTFFTNLVPWQI